MNERSDLPFKLGRRRHRFLGDQVQLQLTDDFVLRLTLAEASSLSFALAAVRSSLSEEREIYLSPIASDADFVGTVQDWGVSIATPIGAIELGWTSVGLLAESLASTIG